MKYFVGDFDLILGWNFVGWIIVGGNVELLVGVEKF